MNRFKYGVSNARLIYIMFTLWILEKELEAEAEERCQVLGLWEIVVQYKKTFIMGS